MPRLIDEIKELSWTWKDGSAATQRTEGRRKGCEWRNSEECLERGLSRIGQVNEEDANFDDQFINDCVPSSGLEKGL